MLEAWCPECQEVVDTSGAACPDCSGPVLTGSHSRSGAFARSRPRKPDPKPIKRVREGSGPVVFRKARTSARKRPTVIKASHSVDPLMKICARCKIMRKHQDRGNGTPRSYCPECVKDYRKEHRKKNWQREKARNTWKGMLARCEDKTQGKGLWGIPSYRDYGAKGVKVSKRWSDPERGFDNFLADMGLPPHPKFTLDRKNPHGNYTRRNCVWVHPDMQRANRKNSRWVEAINPETGEKEVNTVSDWGRITGVGRRRISARLDAGWDPDVAVSKPTAFMLKALEKVPF